MTQEDKQLLLKDLCARLPYEPWVWFKENWETNPNFKGCQAQLRLYHLEYIVNDRDITLKPYLRPMSSMTDEEKRELRKKYNYLISNSDIQIHYHSDGYWDTDTECSFCDYVWLIGWLNSHHFDYRGLIEKGLALEAPEGMYDLKDK